MPRFPSPLPITLLIAALALSGCTTAEPGAERPDPAASEGAGSEGGDTSPTACVAGSWSADLDDVATQLGEVLAEKGMDIITTRTAGTQTASFTEDGAFRFDNDAVIAVDVQLDDGPAMTVAQNHRGTTTASWGWDSTSTRAAMLFTDYDDASYTVENTVAIDGTSVSTPIDIPSTVDTSGRLFVSCSGDELVTSWEHGLFITSWHRA